VQVFRAIVRRVHCKTTYSAKEPFEVGMLHEILTCVQHSPVAQLYTALINMSSGDDTSINLTDVPVRLKQQSNITNADQPVVAYQHSDEPYVVSASAGTTSITQGVILNGQCLCSCPESRHRPSTTSTRTDPLIAASTDYLSKYDTRCRRIMRNPHPFLDNEPLSNLEPSLNLLLPQNKLKHSKDMQRTLFSLQPPDQGSSRLIIGFSNGISF